MNILVTGASGFVGSSFMRQFADVPGLRLFGLGRRPLPDKAAEPDTPLDKNNYRSVDLSQTQDLGLPVAADVVIHAAARAAPWGSITAFRRDNVEATRNVVAYCEMQRPRPRLVYISSSSVFYRNGHQLGLTEESPIGPDFINTYAATKYAGECLVRAYRGEHVILRPRAVFGPGDTVLFPRVLAAARKGRLPLLVSDGPPPIGDLMYIDNLCHYMLKAASCRSLKHDAYNLTNAEPVPIHDFLLDVLRRLQLPVPSRRLSVTTAMRAAWWTECLYRWLRLPGEPPITKFGVNVFAYSKTFDVSRSLEAFGPPPVGVKEGLRRFVQWQESRMPR
jgi:nucleoside-diphosphate-sugar epimerase